jgi:hypothetical protein
VPRQAIHGLDGGQCEIRCRAYLVLMTIDLISESFGSRAALALSQLLTLFTAPIIYLYLDRLQSRPAGRRY